MFKIMCDTDVPPVFLHQSSFHKITHVQKGELIRLYLSYGFLIFLLFIHKTPYYLPHKYFNAQYISEAKQNLPLYGFGSYFEITCS